MKMNDIEFETYDFIRKYKQVNGHSPTHHEIKRGINTKSNRQVEDILSKLRAKNFIDYKDNKPRTITVLKFI